MDGTPGVANPASDPPNELPRERSRPPGHRIESERSRALSLELPAELRDRLQALLPRERWRAATAARAAGVRRIALRVNTLRSTRAAVEHALTTGGLSVRAVDWLPDALVVERGTMAEIQACSQPVPGAWHVQSLSSMVVAHALSPTPGQRILDACAAPGSKASHIAALISNRGRLVAADASRARMFRLRDVLAQLGAVADTPVERAERWGRREPGAFDAVLVDAPCSAEGRALAGDDGAAMDWSLRKCRRLASEQKAILHSAIDACAPGGVVVYSTCTLGPEENEEVLERALHRYSGRLALEAIGVRIPGALGALSSWKGRAFPPELACATRIAPMEANEHPDGPWLEGFFIARMRRIA